MTNCGACTESCCTSPEVGGGTFDRTFMNSGAGPTGEGDPATVSGFRLDKYLVTVGRFRQFVSAWTGGWTPAAGSGTHSYLNGGSGLANCAPGGTFETGWVVSDNSNVSLTASNLGCQSGSDSWTASPGVQETFPMDCVNWWEAYAFCIWDGGFLPTDAEMEFAEAGGTEEREYPWGGAAPGPQYAIYGGATSAPVAVGTSTLGVGRWGQLDLTGQVLEWDLDWAAAYSTCDNCAYLTATAMNERVVRGTNYGFPAATLLANYRYYYAPTSRFGGVGFRCARAP
jgi:sulfatase modifying factor 1